MTHRYGKIISGGRPIDAAEQARFSVEQISAMKARLVRAPLPKTDNVIDQRVAEEMHVARRELEQVESQLTGQARQAAASRTLGEVDDLLEDLAEVVAAKDQCEGVARAAPELKRRLLRRSLDGKPAPCDNR